jgi:ATP-dependent exoDNAse (exonuclease V) beta subunit
MSDILTSFELHAQQLAAVEAREHDIVVTAGAGSGKTRTLVARYLSLLDEGLPPQEIAAVTFTDKAAREMRNRIRQRLHEWRRGGCLPSDQAKWESIEADIDAARIGTIHSLCTGLLRAHPAEAAIDPRFSVIDENTSAVLQTQCIADSLNWAIEQDEMKPLLSAFKLFELERILSRLFHSRLDVEAATENPKVYEAWEHVIRAKVIEFVRDDEIYAAITELRKLRDSGAILDDAGPTLAPQVEGLLAQWDALEQAIERDAGFDSAKELYRIRRPHCDGRSGKKDSLAKAAIRTIKERYDKDLTFWLGNGREGEVEPSEEFERQTAGLTIKIRKLFDYDQKNYQAEKDLRQALDFDDLEKAR